MALQQREIGERIAKLRNSRGNPPQEVVAQQLGVSYRAYQAWEAGDAKPAYRNLSKLAAFFGTTEEFILMGGEEPLRQVPQLDRIERLLVDVSRRLEQLEDLVSARELEEAAQAIENGDAPGQQQRGTRAADADAQ